MSVNKYDSPYLENLVTTMHTIHSIQQTARHHVMYEYTNSIASGECQANRVVWMKLLACHKPRRVVCSCRHVTWTTGAKMTQWSNNYNYGRHDKYNIIGTAADYCIVQAMDSHMENVSSWRLTRLTGGVQSKTLQSPEKSHLCSRYLEP